MCSCPSSKMEDGKLSNGNGGIPVALVSAWMVDKTELTVISGTFLGHRCSRRVIFDGFDRVLVGRFAGFGVGSWLELRGRGADLDCDGASLGDIEIEYILIFWMFQRDGDVDMVVGSGRHDGGER